MITHGLSSYKIKLFRKGEKATAISAEPVALRQWDDVAKSTQIPSQGIKHTFTFDGA